MLAVSLATLASASALLAASARADGDPASDVLATENLFLAQELWLLFRGPLLVIMPGGYGVDRLTGPLATDQSALAGLRAPGPDLGAAAVTAIQRLAAAHGHNLPLPRATAPSTPGSSDTVSWLVFVLGAVVIVIAWIASLRARPLRARGPRSTSP